MARRELRRNQGEPRKYPTLTHREWAPQPTATNEGFCRAYGAGGSFLFRDPRLTPGLNSAAPPALGFCVGAK